MPTLSFVFCMELCQGNALGQAQFNLQRLVGNSEIDCSFFPKNVIFFGECNSVRFGQNIQNALSEGRSIFADVVA